jgi:threonine synthase
VFWGSIVAASPTRGLTMADPFVRMVCEGCGHAPPLDAVSPFSCARRAELPDVDHLLLRHLDLSRAELGRAFAQDEPNPFVRFRRGLYPYWVARHKGQSDEDYVDLVRRLDLAVEKVDGTGFRVNPLRRAPGLARAIGLGTASRLWIKDETGNVSGSHKGRHLFGIQVWLELARGFGWIPPEQATGPQLAIASCGNAALAAAIVARAAREQLRVFVPPDAQPAVLRRLRSLGAKIEPCPREPGRIGDPCMRRFRASIEAGCIPYGCQAVENALGLEGGRTLGYELADQLQDYGAAIDHLVIQVGGGALASALVLSLREADALGVLPKLPRIHTVQTASSHPLHRAWSRLVNRLLDVGSPYTSPPEVRGDASRAAAVARLSAAARVTGLRHAATHRSSFMWPWESMPQSFASGILDDETYDWLPVTAAMIETGGVPVVASEARLHQAYELASAHTDIPVCPTGSAGLAGLIELAQGEVIRPGESVGLVFSGHRR